MVRLIAALCCALVLLAAPAYAGGAPAKPAGPSVEGPFYMRPQAIVAPKFVDGGIIHVGVAVSIQIQEKEDFDKARGLEPRLVNALVRELNIILSGPWMRADAVDHALIKQRFLAASRRILGPIARDLVVEKSYLRRVS
jgi:hypothetical protein